jgi:DNA polymerase-1
MRRAGAAVTGGLEVRTDVSIVRYPDRYSDPRGVDMWNRVTGLLKELEQGNAAAGLAKPAAALI